MNRYHDLSDRLRRDAAAIPEGDADLAARIIAAMPKRRRPPVLLWAASCAAAAALIIGLFAAQRQTHPHPAPAPAPVIVAPIVSAQSLPSLPATLEPGQLTLAIARPFDSEWQALHRDGQAAVDFLVASVGRPLRAASDLATPR